MSEVEQAVGARYNFPGEVQLGKCKGRVRLVVDSNVEEGAAEGGDLN